MSTLHNAPERDIRNNVLEQSIDASEILLATRSVQLAAMLAFNRDWMLFLMDSGQRPITVKLATKQTERPSSNIKEAYLALRPLTLLFLTNYL